jgi:hypothetical protein
MLFVLVLLLKVVLLAVLLVAAPARCKNLRPCNGRTECTISAIPLMQYTVCDVPD